MRVLARRYRWLLVLIACAGCRTEDPLAPREEFHWTEQAVSFPPPPAGWRREGELSGGVRGVRFVKERSVGEAITVREFHRVAERDRTEEIQKLIERFDEMDRRELLHESQLAQSRTDDPYSDLEAEVAEEVNAALERARMAHLSGDLVAAKHELSKALAAAKRFELTLEDVLEKAALEPLRRQEPAFDSFERSSIEVGGEPAVSLAWSFEHARRTYHRREIFVMHDSHLYVARFIGVEKSLPLFDRVVASIEFPQ